METDITDINTLPITLTLNVNSVNVILRSLGKHPFDEINELIKLITRQGEEQIIEWRQTIAKLQETKEIDNEAEEVKDETEGTQE